jgi:glycosyltransferase involved in cell wall biosynthesis
MSASQITVIIPTLGAPKRAMELVRAIESVDRQRGVELVQTLVVVNGHRFDSVLLEQVSSMPRVKVLQIAEAGISIARLHGRRNVETPYFLFLDDDDELYPNALEELLGTFASSDSDTALVIGDAYNDYRNCNYGFKPSAAAIERDPLSTLLDQNWLIVQSALFKTALAPAHLFDLETRSNECTMIAFNLALEKMKVRVNEKALSLIHDKPDSESKTEHFITQENEVVKWMLTKDVPPVIRVKLRRKLAAAFHNNSTYYLERRMFLKSFRAHIQSLLVPEGDSYFLYGRHILMRMLKG